LTPDFTQHADGALADHRPHLRHGSKVTVKVGSAWGVSAFEGGHPSLAVPAVGDGTTAAGHDRSGHGFNGLTPPVQAAFDPWPLLRNHPQGDRASSLHLVVHGRSGGEIPRCLRDLAEAVAHRRQAPVELEALTADSPQLLFKRPLHEPARSHHWLVPLLLLPGSHARFDVPEIRQRLRASGMSVTLLPFLGAWPQWHQLLRGWLLEAGVDSPPQAVVHHPLRPGPADRYLQLLVRQLACPLVAADCWEGFAAAHPDHLPLPLALAPNRMSEALRQAGGSPALLELPLIRSGLIDLLAALP